MQRLNSVGRGRGGGRGGGRFVDASGVLNDRTPFALTGQRNCVRAFLCARSRSHSSAAFCAQAPPGIIAVGVVDGVGALLAEERAKRNTAAQAWCSGDGQEQRRGSWRPFAHLAFGAKFGQKTGTFNSECMVAADASRTGCCRACPICENTTPVVEALAGSMGRFSGELRPPGRGGCR